MVPERLKRDILDGIRGGRYGADGRLPSLRRLSKETSASLATVRKAIEMLKMERVLVSYPGRGIYLLEGLKDFSRTATRTIGLGCLSGEEAVFRCVSGEWLSRGWMIVPYSSGLDHQDRELERKFLQRAYDDGFTGVALHPTPLGGGNMDLIRDLRLRGMKIALFSQIIESESPQCAFLFDHEQAAYQAVVHLALRGCSSFAYVHQATTSVFMLKDLRGVKEACGDYGLKFDGEILLPRWEADADTYEERRRLMIERNESLIPMLRKLPKGTGLLVNQADVAEVVCDLLERSGRSVPEDVSVVYCNLERTGEKETCVSGMEFDVERRVNAALEWIADEKTKASDYHVEYFKPKFVERGTAK